MDCTALVRRNQIVMILVLVVLDLPHSRNEDDYEQEILIRAIGVIRGHLRCKWIRLKLCKPAA